MKAAALICAVAVAAGGIASVLRTASAGASAGASAAAAPRVSPPSMRTDPAAAERAGRVSVWVDLDLPALAEAPRARGAERAALRARIAAQQTAVMRQLRALGAQEQARIQQVRNALAVRIERSRLDAARAIPGVRAVRAVRNVDRPPPLPDR